MSIMSLPAITVSPEYGFWVTIYALTVTVVAVAVVIALLLRFRKHIELTWDSYSESLDISEFSNRNIPLRITYKGTEPRWLWVTYLSLRNTSNVDVAAKDTPERQHFVATAPGCRYIGFNRLISPKAKVTLTPLFKGDDVYCRIDFDRLGPGDEILVSLLFVSEERSEVELEGALFGADSQIIRGSSRRLRAWRSLWWLLIAVIAIGALGGWIFLRTTMLSQHVVIYQLQLLMIMYFLALATAAVFLRPIRYWEKLPQRFNPEAENGNGAWEFIRFMLGLSNKYPGIKQ